MTKQKIKQRLLWILPAVLLFCAFAIRAFSIPLPLWISAVRSGCSPSIYPKSLIALYERNEEARQFVLAYPEKRGRSPEIDLSEEYSPGSVPLLLQWDERWGYRNYNENLMGLSGCGPTCMSMAAIYLTGDTSFNPWWMAQFAQEHGFNVVGSGTSWSFFTDGASLLGLNSTPIPLEQERIYDNLEVGNPIVCVVGPGDFTTEGHFILLVGLENDKIRVHDPNSPSRSRMLWSYQTLAPQIESLWVLRAE